MEGVPGTPWNPLASTPDYTIIVKALNTLLSFAGAIGLHEFA